MIKLLQKLIAGRRIAGLEGRINDLQVSLDNLKSTCAMFNINGSVGGMSWDGFNLIGDKKSIDELKRISHRSFRLEEYQHAFDERKSSFEKKIGDLESELERSRSDEKTSAARLEAYEREAVRLRSDKAEADRVAGLAVKETEVYRDAVKMLVERGAISAIEVAQLNLGRYVPGAEDLPPTIEFEAPTHGKSAVDFGMKSQASEAKFRQVKQHFQQYQAAVSKILDGLNEIGRKNAVTKEDIRRLRELRETVSNILMRSI